MKPPIHCLFPIAGKGGPTRDLLKASVQPNFYTNISNRFCKKCNEPSIGIKCQNCGEKTSLTYVCPSCRATLDEQFCEKCKITKKYIKIYFKTLSLKYINKIIQIFLK